MEDNPYSATQIAHPESKEARLSAAPRLLTWCRRGCYVGIVGGIVLNAVTTVILVSEKSASSTPVDVGVSWLEFVFWGTVFSAAYCAAMGTAVGALLFLIRFRMLGSSSRQVVDDPH